MYIVSTPKKYECSECGKVVDSPIRTSEDLDEYQTVFYIGCSCGHKRVEFVQTTNTPRKSGYYKVDLPSLKWSEPIEKF